MSTWNDLLEHYLQKAGKHEDKNNIENFAIVGYQSGLSGEMWAHSNLNLDFQCRKNLRALLKNPDDAKTDGILIGERRFVYVDGDENMIVGKEKSEDKCPLIIIQTKNTVVVAIGRKSENSKVVDYLVQEIANELADYLTASGF